MSQSSDQELSRGCIVGTIGGVAALLTAIILWAFCWVTVDKGHVGVLSWFGSVEDQTLAPGPHLVHPLKRVYRALQSIVNV